MQGIQLCGQLPPLKLNIGRSEPRRSETRAASRRAARAIRRIDEAIGEACPYCQSDLYEEHPPGPCPACGRYEHRSMPGDRPPLGVPIEYRVGTILSVVP